MLPSWMKSKCFFGLSAVATLVVAGYMYVLFEKEKKRKRQAGIQAAGPDNPVVQHRGEPNCPDYTYDGIILSNDEDLQSSEDRRGVIDLIRHLKGNSAVPNLSLAAYQELGQLAGRTAFDCMDYVLKHCRYIFVYASENLNEDNMTKFQAQMCLYDVIKDNSWRVIPMFADRDSKSSCPHELQLLHGLEMWNFSSPDRNLQNLVIGKFDQTIIDGRKRLEQK